MRLTLLVYTSHLFLQVTGGGLCASGLLTQSGQCCSVCPAGHGLVTPCGTEDTKCAPCQPGVSFSLPEALLSPCLPCTHCPRDVPETASCSPTQDTQCECGSGFYLHGNGTSARCVPCSPCGRGQGVARTCGPLGDTACLPCAAGTFSEERSSSRTCQPCSRCHDNEVEIRACQPNSDTLCMEKKLNILSRPSETDGLRHHPRRGHTEDGYDTSPAPGSPRFTPQEDSGNNIIPVYVSLLAAVVLGLLLYVAYKCWTSCKQKQALGKIRAELSTGAEAEKLHSDSGVFLDSHSLQDSQLSRGSKRDSKLDTRPYLSLSVQRKEEVERLLQEDGERSWRLLASHLGYGQERVDTFGRGEDPVHTLLSDWSVQEGSTLGALCAALGRLDRPDIIVALTQGSSMV